jgi:phage-related protein
MGKAQGDFARTSGGLANQQRILSARFKDAQADLGQKLLPIALKVVTFFNTGFGPATAKIGTGFKQLGGFIKTDVLPPIQSVTGFVKANATAFLAGAAAIAAVATAVGIYKAVMTTVSAVTKAYTAVQAALNVVMALNPIGLVVLALVALAAIFVVLWKRSETFRNVVTGAFNAVKAGVVGVINFFKNLPGNISKAVGSLGSLLKRKGIDLIVGFVKGYVGAYVAVARFFGGLALKVLGAIGNLGKTLFRKGVDLITGLASGYSAVIGKVASFFRGIAGRVLSAIGNLGRTLYSHGSDLIQGLINGIAAKAGALLQKARDLAGSIKKTIGDALKIGSPSKVMIQYGKWVSDGLAIGMKNVAGVKTSAAGLAGAVADGFTAPQLELSANGTAGSGGGTIVIDARGALFLGNEREIAKKIEELLAKGQRFNRSRVVMTA